MKLPIACLSLQITGDKCYSAAFISLVAIKPTNTPKAPGLLGFPFNLLWMSDVLCHQKSCWHSISDTLESAHNGIMEYINHPGLEMHERIVSTVATDALVLRYQTISFHSADQMTFALDQFQSISLNGNNIGIWNYTFKNITQFFFVFFWGGVGGGGGGGGGNYIWKLHNMITMSLRRNDLPHLPLDKMTNRK